MSNFPVTDEEIRALRIKVLRALAAAKYPREAIGTVAANNKLTADDVKVLVAQHGWPNPAAMAEAALELVGGTTPTPVPRPRVDMRPAPAPEPRPVISVASAAHPMPPGQPGDRTEVLLSRAERSEKARTRRLAARVREQLAELLGLLNSEDAERQATARAAAEKEKLRAEVEQLEAELARKRAALKGSKPRQSTGKTESTAKHTPKAIREWAAENNVECSAFGRVPAEVYEAYDAAQKAG